MARSGAAEAALPFPASGGIAAPDGPPATPVPAPADEALIVEPPAVPVPVSEAAPADDPEQARLERQRARAREYQRRKRAAGGRVCAECGGTLPPGAAKHTRFCSRACRTASTNRKNRARLASGAPVGDAWPEAVTVLTARLRRLEAGRRVASPARRGALAPEIRRLTGEIEAAKVAVMTGEGLAA